MTFFTLNNFSRDDGGTVRMVGIINALAKNREITLLSNAKNIDRFNPNIKHIYLNYQIYTTQKRYIQSLLSISNPIFYRFIFPNLIQKLSPKLKDFDEIIFFEYIDNSIGFLFKSVGVIDKYINDIHGIAPLEFKYKKNTLLNKTKYILTSKLDEKVFNNAYGFWFVSNSMKNYFIEKYSSISEKEIKIVRDGISEEIYTQKIDKNLKNSLIDRYGLRDKKVILFIGDFKDMGGIIDLIKAYNLLNRDDTKLLLVGDGELYSRALEFERDDIILVGRIEYQYIRTYQDLADVIVCPDREHIYSHLVPHIKYFDSLISGKVVINGAFNSILEINNGLSINFEPSNIKDLSQKINLGLIENKKIKKDIYKKFSYDKSVEGLFC